MALLTENTYESAPEFDKLDEYIAARSMLPEAKRRFLYEHAIYASFLPDGIVAEAGVWEGGSLYILANVIQDVQIYGFDSWAGLPAQLPEDLDSDLPELYKEVQDAMKFGWGACKPPVDLFTEFDGRVRLIQGWFNETLDTVKGECFRLVHIDCDRYSSCKTCIEFFYPRMVSGGVLIFDDYGFLPTPGVTKAVDDYVAGRLDEFRYTSNCGLYMIMGNRR